MRQVLDLIRGWLQPVGKEQFMTSNRYHRINRSQAGLLVVDIQERLLPAIFEKERVVDNRRTNVRNEGQERFGRDPLWDRGARLRLSDMPGSSGFGQPRLYGSRCRFFAHR